MVEIVNELVQILTEPKFHGKLVVILAGIYIFVLFPFF
jgi:hypothetical protein